MGDYEMSALDAYLNRAYKIIIVLPLTGATTSAFVFTIIRIIGWWPDVSVRAIVLYETGKTPESMLEEADEKLYFGKNNGKNQVVADITKRG